MYSYLIKITPITVIAFITEIAIIAWDRLVMGLIGQADQGIVLRYTTTRADDYDIIMIGSDLLNIKKRQHEVS